MKNNLELQFMGDVVELLCIIARNTDPANVPPYYEPAQRRSYEIEQKWKEFLNDSERFPRKKWQEL